MSGYSNPYASALQPQRPYYNYASWIARVAATIVDGFFGLIAGIPLYAGLVMMAATIESHTDPETGLTVVDQGPSGASIGVIVLGALITIAFAFWNVVWRQGRTGATLGKSALGIRLVSEATGEPIGALMSFVRQLAHVLDSIVCDIGYLWPLWDAKRQTFADKVCGTVVHHPVNQEIYGR